MGSNTKEDERKVAGMFTSSYGRFYAENSRNSYADISTFRNYFGPKPAITVIF